MVRKSMAILCILITLCTNQRIYASEPVRIAFIDSGISTKHIAAKSVIFGKNYVFPEYDTLDREGHGTAVAGMVLGSVVLGIDGICTDALAVPLVSYDLYPSGVVKNGGIETLCEAIYDAVDQFGCRVINISMGIPAESDELLKAVIYAEQHNAVVVSAVGNDNLTYPQRTYYPAAYKSVIGVGAADGKTTADFSQRRAVSVLANGKDIPVVENRNDTQVHMRSGTSYACAYVSGLCARLLRENPNLTPAQVRTLLFASAADIEQTGFDTDSGFGIVGMESYEDGYMVRSDFVQLLYTAENMPATDCTSSFTDAMGNINTVDAIAWAAEQGIVSGVTETEFAPWEYITREQMAAIIYRYAKYKGMDMTVSSTVNCTDSGKIMDYAKEAVSWAAEKQIMSGNPDGLFAPQDNSTRAQAAAVICRTLEIFKQEIK